VAPPSRVAVVVVNHNTREHLQACLASVVPERPREVVVVDNASSDGSACLVRDRYPDVVLHASPVNLGYGAAANQGLARTTAPYVLLLNSDTRLQPSALHALAAYLDRHPGAGVVGPRLVGADGALQPSCYPFPTPLFVLLGDSLLSTEPYVPALRRWYWRAWPHTDPQVVPWVVGAALALRRAAFDAVGGFDESFFLYWEEVDLCRRLRRAAWEVHWAPVTTVVHEGGASTRQDPRAAVLQLHASRLHFYRRHHAGLRLALLLGLDRALVWLKLARAAGRRALTREPARRVELARRVALWRDVLRLPTGPAPGPPGAA
jgi:GT2 family glycosyltransferase